MAEKHPDCAGPICLEKGHQEQSKSSPSDSKEPQAVSPSFGQRMFSGFLRGSFCCVKAVAICVYTCYVVCPPIPSVCSAKIAFHPPSNQRYHFMIKNDNGAEVSATLKQCVGKPIVRIVLELPHTDVQESNMKPIEDAYAFVVSSKNLVAGVYLPCRLWNRPPILQKSVVIFSQPNSSNLSTFLWGSHGFSFREMADKIGCDFYAFDYTGFGLSSGSASERKVYSNVREVYEYVKKTRPDCKIYLMGCSLGTSAAIDLASNVKDDNLAGVILLAAFTSGLGVMCGVHTAAYKFDAFKSINKAPSINVPVLIAHGIKDTIIPYEHSVYLARSIQKPVPVELVRNADHMSILDVNSTAVYKRILNFILSDAPDYDKLYTKEKVMEILDKRLEAFNKQPACTLNDNKL